MLRTAPLVIAMFVLASLAQVAPAAAAQEEAPLYAVRGIVVDETGTPIAGAGVYGWTSPPERSAQTYDETTTDEAGAFTLRLGPGKGQVTANHPAYRATDFVDILVENETDGLRLVLPTPPPRTAIVAGIVRDQDGNPVAGATVTLGRSCCFITDVYEGGASPPMAETSEPEPATPPPASDGNASGAGSPSSGATAPSYAPEPDMRRPIWYDHEHQTQTTGSDGAYRFETHPGPRTLSAHARGYAQTSVEVQARENATVTRDLELHKVPAADATLRIRVVDAATGAPLSGAGVSIQNHAWGRYLWETTGADGRARVTTLPGWTTVNVHYWGGHDVVATDAAEGTAEKISPAPGVPGKQYYAYVKTLRLASGEQELEVRLEPKPEPRVVLTGYVVDPDAKTGIPNAQVSVWNQDTGDWGSATTDATGSYRMLVRPGHYTMNAWAQGHLPGATMFTIRDDELAKRVDVDAPAGEQRYAPCDDADCPYPRPLLAEDKSVEPAMAPRVSTAGAGAPGAPAMQESAVRSAGDDGTRAATFSGSGGGLPPYDPDAAPASGEEGVVAATGDSQVPAAGLLAALAAALVAAALVARRRR